METNEIIKRAELFVRSGSTSEEALSNARCSVENNEPITSNSEADNDQTSWEDDTRRPCDWLMLAFPKQSKHRDAHKDSAARRLENELFIKELFASHDDEHVKDVTYVEILSNRELCCVCCECGTCTDFRRLDYRVAGLRSKLQILFGQDQPDEMTKTGAHTVATKQSPRVIVCQTAPNANIAPDSPAEHALAAASQYALDPQAPSVLQCSAVHKSPSVLQGPSVFNGPSVPQGPSVPKGPSVQDKAVPWDATPFQHEASHTEIHKFLHETCNNTLIANLVFNGHGSRDGLCFKLGDKEHLDNVIENVHRCFRSTPSDLPPFEVQIVFAQCYGDRYTKHKIPDNIEVTHLVKAGQPKTHSFRGAHLQLQQYARERRREWEKNNTSTDTRELEDVEDGEAPSIAGLILDSIESTRL